VEAVGEFLRRQKIEYMHQISAWQDSLKQYENASKLDQLRIRLLQEAGLGNPEPQVHIPVSDLELVYLGAKPRSASLIT
jgi:hypothetical protein